jgi:trigger factor
MKSQVLVGVLLNNTVEVPKILIESVKLGVIVSEIAKQNQIQLDPDRVRELVETIASSYEKPEEVVQWYYGNQDMLSGAQSAVIEEQVVEWVVDHSGIDVNDEKTTFLALVEEAKQSQG